MNIANSRTRPFDLRLILRRIPPAALMMSLILFALFFFEIFNFSTTDYALSDLLGSLTFAGLQWSTILAIAFCSIDFAGIARLFTPDADRSEPRETWYLLGAWMIAATMNAALTWWGVLHGDHEPCSAIHLGGKPKYSDWCGSGLCCHHGLGDPYPYHRIHFLCCKSILPTR